MHKTDAVLYFWNQMVSLCQIDYLYNISNLNNTSNMNKSKERVWVAELVLDIAKDTSRKGIILWLLDTTAAQTDGNTLRFDFVNFEFRGYPLRQIWLTVYSIK